MELTILGTTVLIGLIIGWIVGYFYAKMALKPKNDLKLLSLLY